MDATIKMENMMANIEDVIEEHNQHIGQWPIDLGECRNVDFHFNKKYLEYDFLPMWIIKAKGKTWYVNHVDCKVGWSTREQPDNVATKGAIRIKKCNVYISDEGTAILTC